MIEHTVSSRLVHPGGSEAELESLSHARAVLSVAELQELDLTAWVP